MNISDKEKAKQVRRLSRDLHKDMPRVGSSIRGGATEEHQKLARKEKESLKISGIEVVCGGWRG